MQGRPFVFVLRLQIGASVNQKPDDLRILVELGCHVQWPPFSAVSRIQPGSRIEQIFDIITVVVGRDCPMQCRPLWFHARPVCTGLEEHFDSIWISPRDGIVQGRFFIIILSFQTCASLYEGCNSNRIVEFCREMQGCPFVIVPCLLVSARFEQRLHYLRISALLCGIKQWRLIVVIPSVRIGAGLDQRLDGNRIVALDRPMHGRSFVVLPRFSVHPRIQQGCNHIRVSGIFRRSMQRRDAGIVLRFCVDTCAEAGCHFLDGRRLEIFFRVPPPATHRELCPVHQFQSLAVVLPLAP